MQESGLIEESALDDAAGFAHVGVEVVPTEDDVYGRDGFGMIQQTIANQYRLRVRD